MSLLLEGVGGSSSLYLGDSVTFTCPGGRGQRREATLAPTGQVQERVQLGRARGHRWDCAAI